MRRGKSEREERQGDFGRRWNEYSSMEWFILGERLR